MGFSDAALHVCSFFASAVFTGGMAALLVKLLWRRELSSVSWLRLALAAIAACALVLVGGLVAFGHDGQMATYAAMVLACAAALWWSGFLRRARKS